MGLQSSTSPDTGSGELSSLATDVVAMSAARELDTSGEVSTSLPLDAHKAKKDALLDCRAFLRDSPGYVSDFYEKVSDLREGAFGDVWLARQRVCAGAPEERSGRLVAVKRVRKPTASTGLAELGLEEDEAIEDFRLEVDLMKSLDHPSICRLLQVYEDARNLYLVLEYIEGGELFDRIVLRGSFNECDAAHVIRQVASALSYCHHHGVVHRDIKPENIMLADVETGEDSCDLVPFHELTIKVIDFGFSCRILQGVRLKAKVGTFIYTAPEAFKGEPCDERLDTWALGCVLYVMLSGHAPFRGREDILRGHISFEDSHWANVSDQAKALIVGLLRVDPADRLTASQVHDHPWLNRNAPHELAPKQVALQHLSKLQRFHNQSLFKHLCAGVLARQLDEGSLHELHCTFCALDEDEDGIISVAEFKKACQEAGLASTKDKRELAQIFSGVDMDSSGFIDYTEFIAACIDQKLESKEGACWSAFQVFDQDGDGVVTFEELQKVLESASLQENLSEETMQQLWQKLTSNQDPAVAVASGTVDFEHFLAALQGIELSTLKDKRKDSKAFTPTKEQQSSAPGLPLPPRQQAAAVSLGLPIASRTSGPGLPIASRAAAVASTSLLPISSRR